MDQEKSQEKNIAFIDSQNLHFGTIKCDMCAITLQKNIRDMELLDCICGQAWEVDLTRFYIYLKENYHVNEAYYFMGYVNKNNDELYKQITDAGFTILFKEHNKKAKSAKKGNVDTDIVFEIMKNVIDNTEFNSIVLVSGDGDYIKMVKYLVDKSVFKKVLFPNRKFYSSLYKQLGNEYIVHLSNPDVKELISKSINEKGA